MEDPTRPTERIPPSPPPGGVPPTAPATPIPPAGRTAAASTTETVVPYDDVPLWEELRRIRFWSYFGSALSAIAAILAAVALVLALDARNDDSADSTRPALQGLRQDVTDLRSDVAEARAASEEAADQTDRINARVRRLEGATSDQADLEERLNQIDQEISDLNDRIDQVERAQEEAAAGQP
jgi:hypothetical protein